MNESIETPVATGGKDKGFTLIELLIVIVILGVLATVTVFAVRGISDKGEDSACAADYKTLETAIETWHAKDDHIDAGTAGVAEMADLVSSELLRTPSTNYTINATTGAIEAADCAIPT